MAAKTKKSKSRKYTDILFEVTDQVAWITINLEKVLNAFREQTLDEMIDALKSTREDPSIVCAVINGKGRLLRPRHHHFPRGPGTPPDIRRPAERAA